MRFILAALLVLAGPVSLAGAESPVACPDLAAAKRVGTCPDATELQRYWEETCVRQFQESNNPNVPECARREEFVGLKDVALWEADSAGKLFSGYFACGDKGKKIAGSKAIEVSLECSSKTCNLYCAYQNNFTMALRDAGQCRPSDKKKSSLGKSKTECGAPGKPCQVHCD